MKKTWFITGASRGFGRIWAEAALARGDRVAVTARRPESLKPLVDAYGDSVLPLRVDVTGRAAVTDAVQQAAEVPSRQNGGLSESRRIAWLAFDHNVQVVPHGWNTAIGLAADLQFSAAIPVARYVEYLTPSAYIDEITTEPFHLDDRGTLEIPTRPGLGVELDPDKLKRFCPERVVFD